MRSPLRIGLGIILISLLALPRISHGADVNSEAFATQIQPLLKEYCLHCHSTEKQKGDLDLETFSSLDIVKRHPKIWQGVAEQLANGEMPPKDKPQLTAVENELLTKWVAQTLDSIARERAGDPGPVVLRRLSNAEYTYTIRDLTGIESLQPAREFPVDGAAGEGFMNTGQALVMSPALISKYLEASKNIASHAVLLPDEIRFSSKTTRRDWTEEIVGQIREFYREFTDPRGGEKVNLQGVIFETNEGGRLPLEKYLAAAIAERDALRSGSKSVEMVASEHGINARYLEKLIKIFLDKKPSLMLDGIRSHWLAAKPEDVPQLVAEIARWQKALWKFSSVGHIGKVGGPKAWLEPVNPVASKQELRVKIPASADGKEVKLYLVASDAGDGNEGDAVIWQQPRLVAPGKPEILIRDVRDIARVMASRRERVIASTAKCLDAAAEASESQGRVDVVDLAHRYDVDSDILIAWFNYLGIGPGEPVKIDSYLTGKLPGASNYDFINGWGVPETPNIVANSSGQHVRIPGNMKPHSVAVHPSPKLRVAVGWRSPMAQTVRVDASVTHAHPECGNGVVWALELRRGKIRQRLAAGVAQGSKEVRITPIKSLQVQPGDLVSLLVGPRDGNHSCDLTAVDFTLTNTGNDARKWSLAADVSPDLLSGNPHADRFGNEKVWHFYSEADNGGDRGDSTVPAGSALAKWQVTSSIEERRKLAEAVQNLLLSGPSGAKDSPDTMLFRQLTSAGGPLLPVTKADARASSLDSITASADSHSAEWGVDPRLFSRDQIGHSVGASNLYTAAPSVIEIRLPADLAEGYEFVTTGSLDKVTGAEGSVQFQVLTTKPERKSGLVQSSTSVALANGPWTDNNQRISHSTPILVNDGSNARQRIEEACEEFRQLFPAALCYTKIVPVDEVVTLTLFHREDHHLSRLMLDDTQKAKLDRLWNELHYVSHDALTLVDAFAQLMEYASQDADPKVFEPLRKPIHDRAEAFRQSLIETEPKHVDAILAFADRAYRRRLTEAEKGELRGLYSKLRTQELSHEEAIRLTLARVLVSPAFLYRGETPGPGREQQPINHSELASRLSYFLWASMPDAELRNRAGDGQLGNPETLVLEMRRMLSDSRIRRLATEFACQWLHIYDFDALDEKSERHFPTFNQLRGAMYEESVRFFTDLFQRDGSVLSILDADHAFLNEALAKHYGIPGVTGENWQRVDGVKKFSRGGILAQAATLAKQSGASRTSPILRGNWVAEVLLGDKLPKPPKDVPPLPEEESADTLTVRQLTERHSADPRCYGCHKRIDAFGFSLEKFDAIGQLRDRDAGNRPIDARAKVMDGSEIDGIEGLREYLLTKRRDVFLRQFCRKLLGYALGRAVQLSDEPLLTEMRAGLASDDYRISSAIETILRSRQFLEIRGREMSYED